MNKKPTPQFDRITAMNKISKENGKDTIINQMAFHTCNYIMILNSDQQQPVLKVLVHTCVQCPLLQVRSPVALNAQPLSGYDPYNNVHTSKQNSFQSLLELN